MNTRLYRFITLLLILTLMISPANVNVRAEGTSAVLSSDNLAGPYLIGKMQEFQVRLQNPTSTAYSSVRVKFALTAAEEEITSLQYYETFNNIGWRDLPYAVVDSQLVGYFGPDTGFPVAAGYDAVSSFRVTFADARSYEAIFELVDKTQNEAVITSLEATAQVYGYPVLSSPDLPQSFIVGRQQEFQVRLQNPSPVESYAGMRVKFALTADASDVTSMQYYEAYNETGWLNLPYTVAGDQLVGFFGPASGFPVSGGYDATSRLRVTFAKTGPYQVNFDLVKATTPDIALSSFQSSATVYNLPALSSADLAGPYVVDQSNDFHIQLQNPAPDITYSKVLVRFALTAPAAAISSLQYYETYNEMGWLNLPYTVSGDQLVGVFGPQTGFPVGGSYNATSQFRVTFAQTGNYSVMFTLVDLTTTPETILSTYQATAAVQDLPAISSSNLAGPYVIGKQQDFQVKLQSSPHGKPYTNVRVKFEVPGAKAADVTSIQYYETTNNIGWLPLPLTETATGLEGYFGPQAGFYLPANYSATSQFRGQFAKTGAYQVKLTLVDVTTTPETAVSTYETTADVYGLPVLSSTNLAGSYIVGKAKEFQVRLQNPSPVEIYNGMRIRYELSAAAADIDSLQYYETYNDAGWTDLPFTVDGDKLVGFFGPESGFPVSGSYDSTSRFRVTFLSAKAYSVKFDLVNATSPDAVIATYTNTANAYTVPVLSSEDLDGPYVVSQAKEFAIRLLNPAPDVTYNNMRVKFAIEAEAADLTSLKYFETAQNAGWLDLPYSVNGDELVGYFGPAAGFPVAGAYDATSRFMVTFANKGTYPVTFTLLDVSGGTEIDVSTFKASAEVSEEVSDPPFFSSADLAGPYKVAAAQEFNLRLQNPSESVEYTNAQVKFEITAKMEQVGLLQIWDEATSSWKALTYTVDGDKLVGVLYSEAGFLVSQGYDATSRLKVKFNQTGSYLVKFELVTLDNSTETTITSFSSSAVVTNTSVFLPVILNGASR